MTFCEQKALPPGQETLVIKTIVGWVKKVFQQKTKICRYNTEHLRSKEKKCTGERACKISRALGSCEKEKSHHRKMRIETSARNIELFWWVTAEENRDSFTFFFWIRKEIDTPLPADLPACNFPFHRLDNAPFERHCQHKINIRCRSKLETRLGCLFVIIKNYYRWEGYFCS